MKTSSQDRSHAQSRRGMHHGDAHRHPARDRIDHGHKNAALSQHSTDAQAQQPLLTRADTAPGDEDQYGFDPRSSPFKAQKR